MVVITAENLEKRYGTVEALSGLSVSVDEGELYGFLGPNGAGKTTTIRILTGQIRPDGGSVSVDGTNPVTDPIETRSRVGILPEEGMPPSFFTPREYFRYVSRVRGLETDTVADTVERWADRLGYGSHLDTLNADLSRGQQQKVMITQAFLHDPDVVFIDEPLANLDPMVQATVKAYLTDYAAAGGTALLSTHNIDVAEDICTRVGIVSGGRIVTERDLEMLTEPLLSVFLDEVADGDRPDASEPTIESVQ